MVEPGASRTPPSDDPRELQRLRWQCRRGMLELDQLLGGFLDLGYADLSAIEQLDFQALIGASDPQLSDWFMGRSVPSEPRMQALVARIRTLVSDRSRTSP